ncbi:Uncharacterized protein ChrSV_0018 [Chromobacterium vaccinii]|nr:Uncharacterized protein ChrSW_0018 [Chromobacterium vaccinii]QND87477.1 Uncharacterized protein ChrSV_0018 [Chromobacterium vaccinii]
MTQHAPLEAKVPLAPSETEDALRITVGAAYMLGQEKTKALLALPDEQLGRLIKQGLSEVLDLAALVALGREKTAVHNKSGHGTMKPPAVEHNVPFDFERSALPERQPLVDSGKLLPAAKVWEGLGVTRQALNKAVAAGRIFTVDVGAAQFYPAFYLAADVDRKTLAKVTQLLGSLPGWSKWQFFTTPKASLGNVTPLSALSRGKVEQVAKAAAAFAER